MNKFLLLLLVTFCTIATVSTEAQVVISDADLVAGQTYNWTADNEYLLDGYVFLEEGGVLNIEAGTIIRGKAAPTGNDITSGLIITRDAQIIAEGTSTSPIIFTAEEDPADPLTARGLWGGLMILGRADHADDTPEPKVEGIANDPTDTRVLYGAPDGQRDDTDNSGILRYVSIRHGGSILEDGDEINGLTLGAVGSGTTIEYVEVFANDDDGIEWFGGTVAVKNACVAFCADDSYDYDHGYRGKGQFWFSLSGEDEAGSGGEHDGASPDDQEPASEPTIYNATYIGMGATNLTDDNSEYALYFRDGAGGHYSNSIFTDFAFYALEVEDRADGVDSRQRLEEGKLSLNNNLWFEFGEGSALVSASEPNSMLNATDGAEDTDAQFLIDHLIANENILEDPQLGGISRTANGGLDPRPVESGPAYTTSLDDIPTNDDFYTQVDYKGAFGADDDWIKGWTALDQYGVLASLQFSTGVEELSLQDQGYVLEQNAPNPAEGMTIVRFEIPELSTLSLNVYDITGKEVQQVIGNERYAAGLHSISINTNLLEAGVYFYTLEINDQQLTKEMIVF